MKQHIRMAAILERDGRLFFVRQAPDAAWELPGGPLPPENDDIDAEMDAVLQRLGVMAPAIEEDFLHTHYIPVDDGQVVFNVYAATEWRGEPSPEPGVGAGWLTLEEVESVLMDEHVRNAVLEAYGIRSGNDRSSEILAALSGGLGSAGRGATADQFGGPAEGHSDGEMWANPVLDRRIRGLQVVAMLAATGRTGSMLASYISGALDDGATPEEVAETLRMAGVYAGLPAVMDAWPVMERVFAERGIPRPEAKR